MPRKPRMYLPGVPAHVVQRGNNRDVCFFQASDFEVYLAVLADALRKGDRFIFLILSESKKGPNCWSLFLLPAMEKADRQPHFGGMLGANKGDRFI